MWRMSVLVASAAVWWMWFAPAQAQEGEETTTPEASESADEPGASQPADETEEESGEEIEITLDPDLDEEFTLIEIVVQIAIQAAEAEGETLDLAELEKSLLEVAETDRQKAYVHFRIAQLYHQRGDREAALKSLKKGLPLADGDRSLGSLYHRILVSLLTVYNELGRLDEADEYVKIYREIIGSGAAGTWERLPGTEDVIHKPTGVRLPHKLNIFTRTKLLVYDETGRDAGASYRVEGDRLPYLSVYLVAEFGHDAETHFSSAMMHILNRFKGSNVRSRGPYRAETDKGTVNGFAGHVTVPGQGFQLGQGSDLYVFVREGTLIKFRITFRERNRKKIERMMREIFKTFDWP